MYLPFTRILRLGVTLVALIGLHAEAQRSPATRPADPRGIAAAIGVSSRDLGRAHCNHRVSPMAPPGSLGVLSCLAADGPSWAIVADTSDQVHSGERDWRLPAPRVAVVRDSLARAFDARGLEHLSCPDSVHRPRAHDTRWLSVWRGPTYNVLLFHVQTDDSTLQLTVQVSPGVGQRCYDSP